MIGRQLQRRLGRAMREAGELEQHDIEAEVRHGLKDPAAPGLAPQARLLAIRLRRYLGLMDLADGIPLAQTVERLRDQGIILTRSELRALEASAAAMDNPAGEENMSGG